MSGNGDDDYESLCDEIDDDDGEACDLEYEEYVENQLSSADHFYDRGDDETGRYYELRSMSRWTPSQSAEYRRICDNRRRAAQGLPPKTGPCFIATAVYGDPQAWQVCFLREFRDTALVHNSCGLVFLRVYYKIGPICAYFVSCSALLKSVARFLIDRFILFLNKSRNDSTGAQASMPERPAEGESRAAP